ncbi:MAG: ribosomal protein S18-alanine N-acetyltransferase [bacterium]
MTPEHLGEVLAIEKASFDDPWSLACFRDLLVQPAVSWVAIEDGYVVGYLITIWALDEIHLVNLAVRADRRRCGIGNQLMNFLMKQAKARNARAIYLEVRRSNEAAIAFYRQRGFSLLYERKRYYNNGEDAWIMECGLDVGDGANQEVRESHPTTSGQVT